MSRRYKRGLDGYDHEGAMYEALDYTDLGLHPEFHLLVGTADEQITAMWKVASQQQFSHLAWLAFGGFSVQN